MGPMCGQCPAGMGLRFFKGGCGSNSGCNDLNWVLAVMFLIAAVFSIFLIATTDNRTTATLGVSLFFYQVSPMVKSTRWFGF